MRKLLYALTVVALLGVGLFAQASGGTFIPSANYVTTGTWTFSGVATLVSAVLTTPTITSPTITGATLTTATLTAPTIATVTNTGTETLPSATGGVPVLLHCGTTGSGSQTCAPSTATALTKLYGGRSTLSGSAATITFPTAFTGTTTYDCVADDVTTRANPVQMIAASSTTATITNTTGATDVIQWVCFGN